MITTAAPAPSVASGRSNRLLGAPVVVSLLLAATVVTQGFWLDEAATASAISRSPTQLWEMLTNVDATMSVYYTFMHFWSVVLGSSEIALRAPSVLAMAAAVGLTGLLGGRIRGLPVGLTAATLLAISPIAVKYSVEARPYALATFFVVAAGFVAHHGAKRPATTSAMAGWAVLAAVGVGFHFLAILAVAAQVLWLSERRTRWVWALLPVAVAMAVAAGIMSQPSYQGWIPQLGLVDVPRAFLAMAGAAGVILFGIGALVLLVRRQRLPEDRTDVTVIAGWALAPAVVLAIASLVYQPMFLTRYLIMSMPAIALAVALVAVAAYRSLADYDWLRLATGIVAAVCFLATAASYVVLPPNESEDPRAAVNYISANAEPGDVIVYSPSWGELAPAWYFAREGQSTPRDLTTRPGSTAITNNSLWPAQITVDQAIAGLTTVDRLWVLQADGGDAAVWEPTPNVGGPVAAYVEANWSQVEHRDFGRIKATLWQKSVRS
ncbi:MAG: glycosyltransferase family 39 protein [Candidatus Nanopelagicales bacterium]